MFAESAAAGLWSTAADLARAAVTIRAAAAGESGEFLDAALMSQMLTPAKGTDYGLGVFVNGTGTHRWFGHGGDVPGYKCLSMTYLQNGDGIVVLTNSENGSRLIDDMLIAARTGA